MVLLKGANIEVSSEIRKEQIMFESTTSTRTRDAIRAAHNERGRILTEGLRLFWGGRGKR